MLFVHTLHVFFLMGNAKIAKTALFESNHGFLFVEFKLELLSIHHPNHAKTETYWLGSAEWHIFFLVFKWPFRRWKVTYVTSNLGDPKVTTGRNKGIGCSPNLPWGRQGIAWNTSSPFVQVRKKIWSKHRWILVFLPCEWEHKSLKLLPIA